jgi:integrase
MPIRFYLHTKTYADGRRPIYADIRWGRGGAGSDAEARLRTSTGQSCQPAHWNEAKQRIRSGEMGYAKANNKLAELEGLAGRLLDRAELDQESLSPALLLERLKPGQAPRTKGGVVPGPGAPQPGMAPAVRTMATLLDEWQQAHRGRRAPKTLSGPQGLVDQLERFRPGIRPEDLQADASGRCALLEAFCLYCMEQAKNRTGAIGLFNNTISCYLKQLRKLLKFGRYECEWITDEFGEEVEREPLTFAEVMALYEHVPVERREGGKKPARRKAIRDVFVFNCLTGARYGSLQEVGPDAVVLEHVPGVGEVPIFEYYAYKNRRSKRKVRVPLDALAYAIWQRYGGRLPLPGLGKMNEEIKQLCREAGLTRLVKVVRGVGAKRLEERLPLWKTVSAHIARYTFITTQHEGGASLLDIQDTVGHANINTTRRYTKTREKDRLAATLQSFTTLRGRKE